MKTRTNKFSRSLAFILLTVLCLSALMLTSCGSKKVIENKVFSVDDLEGKSIGVQLGTTGDIYCSDYEGDEAGTIVERYNKGADAVQALKQGKIDAVVIDEQPAKAYVNANQELMILDEEFALEEYAICISKSNSTLKNSINEAIEALKSEGKIQTIIDNYIGENAPKTPYTPTSDGKNGVLKMATNAYFEPYEYYNNGSVTGIDVDIANSIADYLGMKLQIEDMEFDSIITAVASGKVDMGAAGMTVTEERLKNIDFTTSYTTAKQVVIVRNNDGNLTGQNFIEKFKQTFSSGRNKAGTGDTGPFVPPVALQINSPHGARLLALGRRKWRSQGGYPTLTHGGLSLLEVLSPWIEVSR